MNAKKISGLLWSGILSFSWGKIAIALVVILTSLQIIHLILLSRLEDRNSALKKEQLMLNLKQESERLFSKIKTLVEQSQVLDSSGEYQLVRQIYSPEKRRDHGGATPEAVKSDLVTVVTQCSVDHLYHLVELTERWRGPVSLAVFAPGHHVAIAIRALLLLYNCLPAFRDNVTVSVVYPLVHAPVQLSSSQSTTECQELKSSLQNVLTTDHNYAISGVKYPNNLLRNVALSEVHTDYVMVIDIDMLPSVGLHQSFTGFLHSFALSTDSFSQTVFIIPAFEILQHVDTPVNKETLLTLWQQGSVRPFYHELCWRCQRQTDYNSWRNLTLSSGSTATEIKVAYEVEWKDPWEPFYIGPTNVPNYDERFKQYGFNRISQASIVNGFVWLLKILCTDILKGFVILSGM